MQKKLLFLALLIIVTGIGSYVAFNSSENKTPIVEEIPTKDTISVEVEPPKTLYGIIIDSLEVVEGKIKRNQNLSDILTDYQVSLGKIDELAKKSKKVFDVRRLVANKKYTLLCEKDSLHTAQYFVYEPNPTEFVVFGLQDSVNIYSGQKKVEVKEANISGIIATSLYDAIIEQGKKAQLVNDVVDVYAWQVDFMRTQKGDCFKIIYEEKWVDGEVVGLGKIKAAEFKHFGNSIKAFHFDQGSKADYFDEEGNSLRKALLKYPIEFTRISSRYNPRRFHPVQKRYKAHLGTDFAAPRGTPIRAAGDGIIDEARYSKYNGNYVKIRHNGNYSTQYLHMSKIASGVKSGQRIKQGQVIGYVGSTGLATGPHLCYRFWKNGRQVDALKVDLPSSEPVKEDLRDQFQSTKIELAQRLEAISYPVEENSLTAVVF